MPMQHQRAAGKLLASRNSHPLPVVDDIVNTSVLLSTTTLGTGSWALAHLDPAPFGVAASCRKGHRTGAGAAAAVCFAVQHHLLTAGATATAGIGCTPERTP